MLSPIAGKNTQVMHCGFWQLSPCTTKREIRLNLHLSETMFPDRDERGSSILAIVHENDPEYISMVFAQSSAERELTFHQGPSTRQCRNRTP